MALPDDAGRFELIEGELIFNTSLWTAQAMAKGNLSCALSNYLEAWPIGEAFPGPLDVVLSNVTVLTPDVLVVLKERASIIGPLNIQGAPDIVVEVLSDKTRKRDEGVKRRLYERHGVTECWFVDPDAKRVTINGKVMSTITSPLLPGFSLDARDVFAE